MALLRADIIRIIVARDLGHLGLNASRVRQEAAELYEAAVALFGTWETALQYAGVEHRHHRRTKRPPIETEEDVRHEIRRLCISGYSLNGNTVRRRDRDLYNLAIREFGSWPQALIAVGVNLEHCLAFAPSDRLSPEDIIQRIQSRHSAGESLLWEVVCMKDRSLAVLARNHFHGWRNALIAAGFNGDEGFAKHG